MRMYKLYAYRENGDTLFYRLEHYLHDALKTVINHPMASQVAWIKYHGKKFTISEVLKLADRSLKHLKSREYSERWD